MLITSTTPITPYPGPTPRASAVVGARYRAPAVAQARVPPGAPISIPGPGEAPGWGWRIRNVDAPWAAGPALMRISLV